jgi:hypothetical protein
MTVTESFKRWNIAIIPAVFIVAVLLRFASLDADPPSTVGLHFISDEGWWVHNARNKYLYDQWIMDEFNQSLLASPPFCLGTLAVYNIFGVSFASSRIVPVLSGLLTILLLSGLLFARAPPRQAAFGTILLAFNFAFTAMNKTAYVDSTAFMFLVFSWWLMEKLPHRVWAVFLAGMSFALAVITKSYLLTILPPLIAVLGYRLIKNRNTNSWKYVFLNCVLFAGGIFAIYMLWKKYLFVPFEHDYRLMYFLWQDGNFPKSFLEAIRNVPSFFIGQHGNYIIPSRFFGLNAALLVLAGYRIFQLADPNAPSMKTLWKNISDFEKEALIALTILSIQIAPLTAKPFRRYLLLYLPLLILASGSILTSHKYKTRSKSMKLVLAFQYSVPILLTVILLTPFVLGFFTRVLAFESRFLLFLIVGGILSTLTVFITYFNKHRLINRAMPVCVALMILFFIDGGLHLHNLSTRTWTLRDTSRRLGEQYFRPGTMVLGGIAHSLTLENQALPIAIWGREEAPRVLNQDPMHRFSPDYLIILVSIDGLDWVREERYDRYVLKENYIETIHLLPSGKHHRVIAELYRAPEGLPGQSDDLLYVWNI